MWIYLLLQLLDFAGLGFFRALPHWKHFFDCPGCGEHLSWVRFFAAEGIPSSWGPNKRNIRAQSVSSIQHSLLINNHLGK